MKLVFGFGVNDSNYSTSVREELEPVNGKRQQRTVWRCPFYQRWTGFLGRCYGTKNRSSISYEDCSVRLDWKYFMEFRAWMIEQDWQGLQLDKDILIKGNREYSKDACCFVPSYINGLLLSSEGKRGEYPLGVYFNQKQKSFHSSLDRKFLGSFSNSNEAHESWQYAKIRDIELKLERYRLEKFYRLDVHEALITRIDDIKMDIQNYRETKSFK